MPARVVFLCAALLIAVAAAAADGQADFNAAYQRFEAALAKKRYAEAADAAAEAKELGERLYPDDARRLATLTYNHGYALSEARRRGSAYDVLRTARRQPRKAFGNDAMEVVHAELALSKSAPKRRDALCGTSTKRCASPAPAMTARSSPN